MRATARRSDWRTRCPEPPITAARTSETLRTRRPSTSSGAAVSVPRRAHTPRIRMPGLLLIATLLLASVTPTAALTQTTPPVTFSDSLPSVITWPSSLEAEVLNNTTQAVLATVELIGFADSETGITVAPLDLFHPYAPSITIPPAGQATVGFIVRQDVQLSPGQYTGTLVLGVVTHNAVLRKPVTFVVPQPDTGSTETEIAREAPAVTPMVAPAVTSWTMNAVRILPFARPVCAQGLVLGCSIPVMGDGADVDEPLPLAVLTNERGGGLAVRLLGYKGERNARLGLSFDRPWGLTGAYTGDLSFSAIGQTTGESDSSDRVALTVSVKDIIVWPLLCLGLGILLARRLQHYTTVHRTAIKLLNRLSDASLTFAKQRKSIHGYTIAEDFHKQRDGLEKAIRDWDRTHFGTPTDAERNDLETGILRPLAELEDQLQIWGSFRDKLERLSRRLIQEAQPAINAAEKPSGVELPQPRFFTLARQLQNGTRLEMSQVVEYAARIDSAAELAARWGEMHRLSVLVTDAIRQLHRQELGLSDHEREMLEAARHHVNSAIRDLWEATDMDDLRSRETQDELAAAQELTRRLMDPFIYYAGSERAAQIEADIRASEAGGEAQEQAVDFRVTAFADAQSAARTYARLETYRLPRLDLETYGSRESDSHPSTPLGQTLLVSERTITWVAAAVALLAGLDRYFNTNFGTLADYLALFTWAFAAKVGLELANAALSRFVRRAGA